MLESGTIPLPVNCLAFYKLLLSFYPDPYRRRFSREMSQILEDMYYDELSEYGRVRTTFWLSVYFDITRSIMSQHVESIKKQGPVVYLRQTLRFSFYNIIGAFLLLPSVAVTGVGFLSRIAQGDLFHYNRPVYNFLSHTPIYWYPVLFTWVILFPLIAMIINLVPILDNIGRRRFTTLGIPFIRQNLISLGLLSIAFAFLAMVRLHDFAPCMVHGLLKAGPGQLSRIISVCQKA